MHLHQF